MVGVAFPLASFVLTRLFGAFVDDRWVWINFGLGLILLSLALILDAKSMWAWLRVGASRRLVQSGGSLWPTLLALVILWGAGFVLQRHPVRFDWSEAGSNTLSAQTQLVLQAIDRKVEILAFYRSPKKLESVQALLDRYRAASPHLEIRLIDPNLHPDLVDQQGLSGVQLEKGGLVRLVQGDQNETLVGLMDTASRLVGEERPALSEELLTNALFRLTHRGDRVVYVLEGHGERVIEGEGATGATGFSRAAAAIREEGFRVEGLMLLATGEVPADGDVLLIAGPTHAFSETALGALRSFLLRGGALFILLDPRTESKLEPFLAGFGIRVGDDIVVDRTQSVSGRPVTPIVALYGDHPATRSLGKATVFHLARSVTLDKEKAAGLIEVLFASENSWAERNLAEFFSEGKAERGEEDLPGPVSLGVAGTLALDEIAGARTVTPVRGDARIFVVGDADFASNQMLDLLGNHDLLLNAVRWLGDDSKAIAIRPTQTRVSRFRPTQIAMNRIRFLVLFLFPEIIAFVGVIVWWRRAARG